MNKSPFLAPNPTEGVSFQTSFDKSNLTEHLLALSRSVCVSWWFTIFMDFKAAELHQSSLEAQREREIITHTQANDDTALVYHVNVCESVLQVQNKSWKWLLVFCWRYTFQAPTEITQINDIRELGMNGSHVVNLWRADKLYQNNMKFKPSVP